MTPHTGFSERIFSAADGLKLYYRDYGPGDPLKTPALCLPGLTRNSRDFHTLALRLHETGRRVLALDWRGRGQSERDPNWRNYQAAIYLDDIRHLLCVAGVARCILIGTSMGGIMGMGMAAVMPTVLAGVVLNDVGPDIDPAGLARIIALVGTEHPQPDWATAAAKLKKYSPPMSLATDEEWLDYAHATFRQGDDGLLHYDWDLKIIEPMRKGYPTPDLWPLFRALKNIPTLAVRGAVSDILSAETLGRMHHAIPNLLSVTVPNVGHVPTLNEPEAAEAIDAILARC